MSLLIVLPVASAFTAASSHFQSICSFSCILSGTSQKDADSVDAPALESLAQEIQAQKRLKNLKEDQIKVMSSRQGKSNVSCQVRLSALRHDATAFLEEYGPTAILQGCWTPDLLRLFLNGEDAEAHLCFAWPN